MTVSSERGQSKRAGAPLLRRPLSDAFRRDVSGQQFAHSRREWRLARVFAENENGSWRKACT